MYAITHCPAQVLSESVSKALLLTGGPDATETVKFVDIFDKFFDCLNVSNFINGTRTRKAFCNPYRNSDDIRLKVSNSSCDSYMS